MPNWTTTLIFSDDLEKLEAPDGGKLFRKEDEGVRMVDFERLIPMPKSLNISSPPDEKAVIAYLTEKFNKPVTEEITSLTITICHGRFPFMTFEDYKKSYEEFAKTVDPNEETSLYHNLNGDDVMLTLYDKGKIYVDNYVNYGSSNWYDWACENWGVKWNATNDMTEWTCDDMIQINTAWTTPMEFFIAMSAQYPDLKANIIFADEDYGNGCGLAVIKNGTFQVMHLVPFSRDAFRVAIFLLGEWLDPDEEDTPETYKEAIQMPITEDMLRRGPSGLNFKQIDAPKPMLKE